MPNDIDPNSFDDAARELIRKKLLQYMQENAIGVPTLAKRIDDADPENHVIPIKTLQRFLSGKTRTDNRLVALCHRFAERMPMKPSISTSAS